MTVTHNEIVQACEPVLKNAHFHRNSSERGFLTAYQIWLLLRERNPEFRHTLLQECGPAFCKGGGDQDGPAKRIAQALAAPAQAAVIETL